MENEGIFWTRYKGYKKGPEQDQRVSTNRHLFFEMLLRGIKGNFGVFTHPPAAKAFQNRDNSQLNSVNYQPSSCPM